MAQNPKSQILFLDFDIYSESFTKNIWLISFEFGPQMLGYAQN